MKRGLLWKSVAAVCLVAMLLPIFSALTATPVDATTHAPYPYAMEAFGQTHSGIYSTSSAPVMDGTKEACYTDLGNTGTFISSQPDGSNSNSPASEYFPKSVTLYAAYDETALYFYVEAINRAQDDASLNIKLGHTFSEKQTDAQIGTVKSFTPGEDSVTSGNGFYITTSFHEKVFDSTAIDGYDTFKTIYEFTVTYDEIGLTATPEKLYFSASFAFDGGIPAPYYWFWGTPNSAMLPTDESVGSALSKDGLESAGFTPNVLEFLGNKNGKTDVTPSITNVIRTDSFTDAKRTFRAMVSFNLAAEEVKDTGILYIKTKDLGGTHLKKGSAEELNCTDVTGTTATNFDGNITIDEADYNTFYSLRPYAVLTDDSVVYGPYYTLSSLFFDSGNKEYPRGEMKLLMIGCSFNYYHLNEVISIAKSAGLHLTVGNVYRSGAPSIETWTMLVNDAAKWDFYLRDPDNNLADSAAGQKNMTIKECLGVVDHWDVITVQDHYGITISDTLKECVNKSMPYLPNVFRYLEVNHPNSRLYLNQTWAFQPGYTWAGSNLKTDENGNAALAQSGSKYKIQVQGPVLFDDNGNVLFEYDAANADWAGTGYYNPALSVPADSSDTDQKYTPAGATNRMNTVEQQTRDWNNIKACTEYICTSTGINMIPMGSAWQLARHKTYTLSDKTSYQVGDILCNKGPNGSNASGDYYHDGNTGGGQYLNACVLYEVLTGQSVLEIEKVFVPDGSNNKDDYALNEKQAEALRMAAHEAVETSRAQGLTDHYGK